MTAHSLTGPPASRTARSWLASRVVRALGPLAALLLLVLPAAGQTTEGTPTPGSDSLGGHAAFSDARLGDLGTAYEGTIDAKEYRLGPGDELSLDVVGRINTSAQAVVDPEGELWIPDFGRVHVAGLTLDGARAAVRKMFRGSTHGVDAYLRLVRMRRIRVYVSGLVKNPGLLEVTPRTRASELLDRAGGPLDHASLRNLVLRAADGTTRPVDLMRFERLGDRAANPYALEGDQLFVPQEDQHVYVYGPLPFNGQYEYRAGDGLRGLVALAGGLLAEADPAHAQLLRFREPAVTESIQVDLPAILRGEGDVPLAPGDRLFVPSRADFRRDRHVTIVGEVVRPGTYPLDEGRERLSTLVHEAGGFTPDASRSSVLLLRADGVGLDRDPEFQRLSRLSRGEMTSSEYQVFRTKLASAQTTFLVDATRIPSLAGDQAPGAGVADSDRDVLLQAEDVVRVERLDHSVRVMGRVRRPGLVAYGQGLSGERYIELAGGFAAGASEGATRVTRSATGQTLALKDVPAIGPGDLIYVPERADHNVLAGLRDALLVAGSIATIVIAFRR